MTTAQQSPSIHRDHLVNTLGLKTTEAIEGIVLEALVKGSNDLVAKQRDIIKAAAATKEPAAAKAANDATPAVKAAAAAVGEAVKSGNPDDVAVAKAAVAKAEDKVSTAEASVQEALKRLEARTDALEARTDKLGSPS